MLPRFDRVQVCTRENSEYLAVVPSRAGADGIAGRVCAPASTPRATSSVPRGREPVTMLFLGSFRHTPNRVALDWFVARRCCR